MDGWVSALSGFGVAGRDKRLSLGFNPKELTRQEIEDIWRANDLGAKIVELIPNEALREGFELNLGDKDLAETAMSHLETLETIPKLLEALYYRRAYGGSAIFPVLNDLSDDLSQPLNMETIPTIHHFIVLEPRELIPIRYYTSIMDKKFGEPSHYQLIPQTRQSVSGMQIVHESRLVIFHGIKVSRVQQNINQWGDSVLNRPHDVIRDYDTSWQAASALLHEFGYASMKVKGLAELMAKDKDDIIKKRIQAVILSRSAIGATLMDAEESFERHQVPVAGMAELLKMFVNRVSAAADIPATLLMGMSPAGLNATGESDIRAFYDRVNVHRNLHMKPQLEQIVRLLLNSKDGPTKGKEPEVWSVTFPSLWQPSEKEVADTRKTVADTDKTNIEAGIVTSKEVRASRFEGDTYSMETVIKPKEQDEALIQPGEEEEFLEEGEANPTVELENQPTEPAKTAMNGAQVGSMVAVVTSSVNGEISRESAIGILMVGFQLTKEQAQDVLGPEAFEAKKPDPVVPPPPA